MENFVQHVVKKIWYNYFSRSKHDFVDNCVKKEFNALTPSVHGIVLHTSKNLAGVTGLNEILIPLENKIKRTLKNSYIKICENFYETVLRQGCFLGNFPKFLEQLFCRILLRGASIRLFSLILSN